MIGSDETMVKLIVEFDGNEALPRPTLRTRDGGIGSESDDDDSIERGIPVDVPLPPSNRLLPFTQVNPENQEDGGFNRILSDHCARVNSMGLEPAAW